MEISGYSGLFHLVGKDFALMISWSKRKGLGNGKDNLGWSVDGAKT